MHGQHAVCGACVYVCVLTWMEPLYCMASILYVVRVCMCACSPGWSPCITWPACCVWCMSACSPGWSPCIAWPACCVWCMCACLHAHLDGALVLHGQHAVCGVCVHVCMLTWMEPLYCMASMLCVWCMSACLHVCMLTWMEPLYCMASMLCVVCVCMYACSPGWSPCIAWPACCVWCVCAYMRAYLDGALVLHGQYAVCGACVHVCVLTWMEPLYCMASMLCVWCKCACMCAHLDGTLVVHGQHAVCVVQVCMYACSPGWNPYIAWPACCVCLCVHVCMYACSTVWNPYTAWSVCCVWCSVCMYVCSPGWSPCIAWPACCVWCMCACMCAHLDGALVLHGQHAVCGAVCACMHAHLDGALVLHGQHDTFLLQGSFL